MKDPQEARPERNLLVLWGNHVLESADLNVVATQLAAQPELVVVCGIAAQGIEARSGASDPRRSENSLHVPVHERLIVVRLDRATSAEIAVLGGDVYLSPVSDSAPTSWFADVPVEQSALRAVARELVLYDLRAATDAVSASKALRALQANGFFRAYLGVEGFSAVAAASDQIAALRGSAISSGVLALGEALAALLIAHTPADSFGVTRGGLLASQPEALLYLELREASVRLSIKGAMWEEREVAGRPVYRSFWGRYSSITIASLDEAYRVVPQVAERIQRNSYRRPRGVPRRSAT